MLDMIKINGSEGSSASVRLDRKASELTDEGKIINALKEKK